MTRPERTAVSSFERLSQEIRARHQDELFWWNLLGHSFATLLKQNDYSDKEQLYYLQWFQRWILGGLGPRPIDGKAFYDATFTYDGSPLEFSLNWREKKSQRTLRFAHEPFTRDSGTDIDPFNQRSAQALLTAMAKDVPGIDLARFNTLLEEFRVPNDDVEHVLSKISDFRSFVIIAYDLEDGAVLPKCYFTPEAKAIHTNTTPDVVAFNAIRKCNGPHGSYDASINVVDAYWKSIAAQDRPQIVMLAHDCVADSPSSRLKLYGLSPTRTLAQAIAHYDLGGALTGEMTATGVAALRSFWCHMLDLDSASPDVESKEVLPEGSKIMFVYETRPTKHDEQKVDIVVKMQIQCKSLGQNDTEIAMKLSTWFHEHGDTDFASRYQTDLAAAL
jgi:DMATS type aromatic prenyltransferase